VKSVGNIAISMLTSSEHSNVDSSQESSSNTGSQDELTSVDVKFTSLSLCPVDLVLTFWGVGKLFSNDTLDSEKSDDGSSSSSDVVPVPRNVSSSVRVVTDGRKESDVGYDRNISAVISQQFCAYKCVDTHQLPSNHPKHQVGERCPWPSRSKRQ
jgi:hypothetical protein